MCHKLSNLLSTCVKWICISEIEPTEIDPFRHHPNTERAANGSLGVWELRLYSSGISNWELSMPISKSTRSHGVIWGIGMSLKWEYCVMSTDTGGYLAGMDGTTRTLWICWQNAPSVDATLIDTHFDETDAPIADIVLIVYLWRDPSKPNAQPNVQRETYSLNLCPIMLGHVSR